MVLISFPRDISDFPLYDGRTFKGKINWLMSWVRNHPDEFTDGAAALPSCKEVGYLLGARSTTTRRSTWTASRRIIDAVGGVTVDNPKAINDPRYDWLDGSRGFQLSAGEHKLDGETALAYVRSRQGDGDNDFSRARRQQQVLLALRDKLTQPEMLPELPGILDMAGKTMRTNFPSDRIGEMVDLASGWTREDVRQYVLGPSKYAGPPPATARPTASTGCGSRWTRWPSSRWSMFGDASRYASLPEYAPTRPPDRRA